MRAPIVLAFSLALLLLAPPALLSAEAGHALPRIVMPYGQNERHVPVVAGYEVAPRPHGCDAGTIAPTRTLFSEDFESAAPQVTIAKDLAQVHDEESYVNLFHVTRSIANEKGTDEGHSGDGRLYFGHSDTGRLDHDGWRLGGTASFPPFLVPREPTFVSWADKFEMEGLLGYDHVWLELVDHWRGRVYILCSTDADVRPDKSSSNESMSTCSPYRTMLCPTGVHGHGGLNDATCPFLPVCTPTGLESFDLAQLGLDRLDPRAPHWERRYVQIPDTFAGREVTIRFSVDTADGVANQYLGWMADDVAISTGLPIPEPYVYAPVPPGGR